MIDESSKYSDNANPDLELPVPQFDEGASANAQPVEAIPERAYAVSADRSISARPGRAVSRKVFAAVLVAGMALGTLAGSLLGKRHQSLVGETPVAAEPTVSVAAEPAAVSDQGGNESLAGFANELQDSSQRVPRRSGRRVQRQYSQGRPQAYRVGVIR